MITPKLTISNFKGISQREINNYKQTLNDNLNVNLVSREYPGQGGWMSDARGLMNYLNQHDFRFYEGPTINSQTIDKFIDRVLKEEEEDKADDINHAANAYANELFNEINHPPPNPNFIAPLDNYTAIPDPPSLSLADEIGNLAAKNRLEDYLNIPQINLQHMPEAIPKGNGTEIIRHMNRDFSENQMLNQPQVDPLEDLVVNTISVPDLLNIYNKYSPNLIGLQELRSRFQGNENGAKAYLIDEILRAARDGYLVKAGGGFGQKKGMQELYNIVIGLQRDVKRVANAISPQGAERLVEKHNIKNPKSPWSLNKKVPNAPASLENLHDENNDGIPDVVIRNSRGEPMYVNGYTTKNSDYPIALHYYNAFPTRKDRSGISKAAFKKDLFRVEYDDDNEDAGQKGNVKSWNMPPAFEHYNLDGYTFREPKRLSAYQRFMKYIIGVVKDAAFTAAEKNLRKEIPKEFRLAILSKAASLIWNNNILAEIFKKYNATTPDAQKKIKKKAAGEIDATISTLIARMNDMEDGETFPSIVNALTDTICQVFNGQA